MRAMRRMAWIAVGLAMAMAAHAGEGAETAREEAQPTQQRAANVLAGVAVSSGGTPAPRDAVSMPRRAAWPAGKQVAESTAKQLFPLTPVSFLPFNPLTFIQAAALASIPFLKLLKAASVFRFVCVGGPPCRALFPSVTSISDPKPSFDEWIAGNPDAPTTTTTSTQPSSTTSTSSSTSPMMMGR